MPQIIIDLKEYEELKEKVADLESNLEQLVEDGVKNSIEYASVQHIAFLPIQIKYISIENIEAEILIKDQRVLNFLNRTMPSYSSIESLVKSITDKIKEDNALWLERTQLKQKAADQKKTFWQKITGK